MIDREAEKKEAIFRIRYPALDQVCDARFLQMDIEQAEFLSGKFLGDDGGRSISIVYVCLDSDARGLSCALALLAKLKASQTPIVVRMTQDEGLATLIQNMNAEFARTHRVHAFSMISATCRREMILNESQDVLAREIHQAYVRKQESEGRTLQDNPSMAAWDVLSEDMKDSNRQQADHIPVKLRAVACGAHPISGDGAVPFEFTPAEVESLAKIEHARWNAERLLAGWSYDPRPKDLERKTSPYLEDWDEVPEYIKDYNRNTVREMSALLARVGLQIHR